MKSPPEDLKTQIKTLNNQNAANAKALAILRNFLLTPTDLDSEKNNSDLLTPFVTSNRKKI